MFADSATVSKATEGVNNIERKTVDFLMNWFGSENLTVDVDKS